VILAIVGGLLVVAPWSFVGFNAFAIGAATGAVSLTAFSLGFTSFGFHFLPYLPIWFELGAIDQRGIEKTGWEVVPFENKPIFAVQESLWKWKVGKESEKDCTQEVAWIWADNEKDNPKPFKDLDIFDLYKRVGLKTLICAKQQGIQVQKGFLSLEKDWLWFRYRLPIHVDSVRK
jgi:hypothetical protein